MPSTSAAKTNSDLAIKREAFAAAMRNGMQNSISNNTKNLAKSEHARSMLTRTNDADADLPSASLGVDFSLDRLMHGRNNKRLSFEQNTANRNGSDSAITQLITHHENGNSHARTAEEDSVFVFQHDQDLRTASSRVEHQTFHT